MPATGTEIPVGRSYLFSDVHGQNTAYAILQHLLVRGHRGLVLSTTHPDKIPSLFEVDCPVIWIVSRPLAGAKVITVDPMRLARIYSMIADFTKNNPGAAVLLDGIAHLIEENDFTSVMKTIQLITETVALTDSILLLPIAQSTISVQEFSFLEREVPPFDMNIDYL